jgi:hypothetical protein
MNIVQKNSDSIKTVKQELIDFDTVLNLSTMIESRINSATTIIDNNRNIENINEKNPPMWFVEALKNVRCVFFLILRILIFFFF